MSEQEPGAGDPAGPDEQPVWHVISYVKWRAGGVTECCGRSVLTIPKIDCCAPSFSHMEPEYRRCEGDS